MSGGDWVVWCQVCGRKYNGPDLRRRYDGLMVCDKDWETRHPQDGVPIIRTSEPPPYVTSPPYDLNPTGETPYNAAATENWY